MSLKCHQEWITHTTQSLQILIKVQINHEDKWATQAEFPPCFFFSPRTVPSLKPTTPSWCWPTRARCSSIRSRPHRPECWWTSEERCHVTCQSTWLRRSTRSCQVRDRNTLIWRSLSWRDCWKHFKKLWLSGRGGRRTVPPRTQRLKGLTFMALSAIQPKYQFHSVKAPGIESRWEIDKWPFRQREKRPFLVHLWVFTHKGSRVIDPPALSFPPSSRAFKGAFHGGAAERSTQVHACQLPPSLPCQQARYRSVIDMWCCLESPRGISYSARKHSSIILLTVA